MGLYVLRRTGWLAVVIAAVTLITFLVYFILPASHDVMFWYWTHGKSTALADRLRTHALGLDRPMLVQYGTFLKGLVLGNSSGWPGLGFSMSTRTPIAPILASRALVSLQLLAGAVVLWLAGALPLGILGAVKPRSKTDRVSMGLILVGISCPVFLAGQLALYLVVYRLHLLPDAGFVSMGDGFRQWFGHLLLPWIVLALWFAAFYARMLRAAMRETLSEDYIRTARANGLPERRVVLGHGFRSAASPLLTMLGMDIGTMLGGMIIVEKVFNLPGLGNYLLQSVAARDFTSLVAISLVAAVTVSVANLIVDVIHAYLDPRVRYA